MKRPILFILILSAISLTGCSKSNPVDANKEIHKVTEVEDFKAIKLEKWKPISITWETDAYYVRIWLSNSKQIYTSEKWILRIVYSDGRNILVYIGNIGYDAFDIPELGGSAESVELYGILQEEE